MPTLRQIEDSQRRAAPVLQALLALTPFERGLILCWFCDTCRKDIGPGKSCECKD